MVHFRFRITGLMLAFGLILAGWGPAAARPLPQAGTITAQEQQMVDLVNAERQKAGLKPLEVDPKLVETARTKSQDMVAQDYFSHNSPTFGSPFDQLKKAGITYQTAAENIAQAPTVEQAMASLMKSPGHRANILNKNFTRIGIGIVESGPKGLTVTQQFIG